MKTDIIRPLNHRLAVVCLALFCAWTSAAQAATHAVINLADNGPGSLRAALANAADGDTIGWDVSEGTILLTGGELLVTTSVTILDAYNTVTVDGNSAGRVFHVRPNIVVSISGLTITNGSATLRQRAHRRTPFGGGIYNDHASLTISNCTLSGNQARHGGAVYVNGGTLAVSDCTFSDNSAAYFGGAIYHRGDVYGSVTLQIDTSTLSGNKARHGGGLYANGGNLSIGTSTFSVNNAGFGGAVYVKGGILSLYNSALFHNTAAYFGGGIYNHGGANGSATLRILNSTLSGNSARADRGGAIFNRGGYNYRGASGRATLQIFNCTLSGNSPAEAVRGGGIYNRGCPYGCATLEIVSTILNGGSLGRNIYSHGGTVNSFGNNLSSDHGSGFLTTVSDRLNTDPLLRPLADNGGPIFTHALSRSSPAIDAGINFASAISDLRGAGFLRTLDDPSVPNGIGGDGTDIGAFESVKGANSFPNGVAAGDVSQSSAVLWARAEYPETVRFEYGTNSTFAVIDGATNVVVQNEKIPAKAEIDGLRAGTQYYYRASFAAAPSSPEAPGSQAMGKFRTPFCNGTNGLRFGVSSCWRGDLKPFVSIRNIPDRDLDFFVALGDTAYADSGLAPDGAANDLAGFRRKQEYAFAEYRDPGDNFFAAARTSTVFYATIDDHEVTDNFAGGAPTTTRKGSSNYAKDEKDFFNETLLFRRALQAFDEYWPIRDERYGNSGPPRIANKRKLYRTRTFGNDAAIFLLDTRSFRDEQLGPIHDSILFESKAYREDRTMLSYAQRDALLGDLLSAEREGITWKFVLVAEPIQNLGSGAAGDRFEGYAWERSIILDYIKSRGIQNVVFISGDIHGTIANDLTYKEKARGDVKDTSMWDISTGPAAYDPPFGPLIVGILKGKKEEEKFNSLDRTEQNAYVRDLMNDKQLDKDEPRIGLGGENRATLVEGQYLSINTFGWTEFEIDAEQKLTVTTWGVNWYDRAKNKHVGFNKKEYDSVMLRQPFVVSKFEVTPR